MSKYLSSLANKAQAAVNASPLAQHLPSSVQQQLSGHGRPAQPGPPGQQTPPPPPGTQPSGAYPPPAGYQGGVGHQGQEQHVHYPTANEAAAQGGPRHHVIESLQHSLRSLQVHYGPQPSEDIRQLQLIIATQKSVALDYEAVGRDSKLASKELYMWGQTEKEDIKDVTDRLAYLTYVQGSLSSTLSTSVESSRTSFKALRDAEHNLHPRRNIRNNLQAQITRLKQDPSLARAGPNAALNKIADLEAQLKKAQADDEPLEREAEILKRRAIKETELARWNALREYSEKLLLVAEAARGVVEALPSVPPSVQTPYTGAQTTAHIRASLQRALDNYKTGHITLGPSHHNSVDSDTRSFGESHASELNSLISSGPTPHEPYPLATSVPGQPTPHPNPPTDHLQPSPTAQSIVGTANHPHPTYSPPASGPLNAAALNHSPAPIPAPAGSPPSGGGYLPGPAPVPTHSDGSNFLSGTPAAPSHTYGSAAEYHSSAPSAFPSSHTGAPVEQPPSASVASPVTAPVTAVLAGPTVAETGVPLTGGASGPGPASGSLSGGVVSASDEHHPSSTSVPAYGSAAAVHESAEDEKRRLEREERERVLSATPTGPTNTNTNTNTTSEGGWAGRGSSGYTDPSKDEQGGAPPPYRDWS